MTFNTARNILAIMFYGTEEGKKINRVLCDVDENPWHTGIPTEEGWYLYEWGISGGSYATYRADTKEELEYLQNAKRWQKIEEN